MQKYAQDNNQGISVNSVLSTSANILIAANEAGECCTSMLYIYMSGEVDLSISIKCKTTFRVNNPSKSIYRLQKTKGSKKVDEMS